MEKIISLLMCLMLCFFLCFNSFADSAGDIHEKFLVENKEEIEAVKKTIESNNENPSNRQVDIDSLEFDKSYRLYFLNDGDVVKAYEDKGSFGDNITDKYCWIVPYTDSSAGELEVVRSDNSPTGWALRVDTDFQTKIAQNYDGVDSSIRGVLKVVLDAFPDVDIQTFRFCSCKQFMCRLLYFTENGEEYIIPYFAEPTSSVTTAKIYKASDFISAVKNHLSSSTETIETEPAPGSSFDKIFIIYLTIGTVAVLIFVLIVIFLKNRKGNEENPDDGSAENKDEDGKL